MEYSKFMILEGVRKWALMGEVAFAKIEMECLKIENFIVATKQEIQLLEVEEKVVEKQHEATKKMGGNSFWPKPILHPSVNFDRLGYIQIKPSGICDQGFHYNDIIVTFCRHTFHHFCLSKILRDGNSCSICEQVLHLD
jgi:hypothetical protein